MSLICEPHWIIGNHYVTLVRLFDVTVASPAVECRYNARVTRCFSNVCEASGVSAYASVAERLWGVHRPLNSPAAAWICHIQPN